MINCGGWGTRVSCEQTEYEIPRLVETKRWWEEKAGTELADNYILIQPYVVP